MSSGPTPASANSRLEVSTAGDIVRSPRWFEISVCPDPHTAPEIVTGTCRRSRARSGVVTTTAMPTSVSRQQSKSRRGSTIQRDDR